ncbi:hypothetical protein BASA81_002137 [Batrachochytrium salamandrivorans]|nr:hypothetical protein BASA81_002137 [Batrachochytrium salamandrivorans]
MLLFVGLLLSSQLALGYTSSRMYSAVDGVVDLVAVAKPVRSVYNFPEESPKANIWAYHTCRKVYDDQMDCPSTNFWPFGTHIQLERGDVLKLRLVNRLPDRHTNIHYHGMVVDAGYNKDFTVFGDYSYVTSYNSQVETNVTEPEFPIFLKRDFVDYSFPIPKKHPYGLFWFHGHNPDHAGALQDEGNSDALNFGLSGSMSIGSVKNFVSHLDGVPQYTFVLRNTYFNANRTLQAGGAPNFCDNTTPLPGYCAGVGRSAGSRLYYTVGQQVFPELPVGKEGAVWRIVHAMSNANAILSLVHKNDHNKTIPFQVLWVDGASLLADPGVLTQAFFIMPSSRIIVYIPPQDDDVDAVLLSSGPTHGTDPASPFPNVLLASVKFSNGKYGVANNRHPVARSSGDVEKAIEEPPRSDISCDGLPPLAEGHRRRIIYKVTGISFMLGYEEVGLDGLVVPGTARPPETFNPHNTTVCAAYGENEIWELFNDSDLDHNFHIHQTKFKVLNNPDIRPGFIMPDEFVDNAPLRAHSTTFVEIPFLVTGDYMYHCHIMFHSDHGMMGRVRVAKYAEGKGDGGGSGGGHHH